MCWRRRPAGELDHEFVWLAVTTAGAAALLVAVWLGLPLPGCAFRMVTGHPCLTCGATHAALALSHGAVGEAWRFNPLATAALLLLGAFNIYALVVLMLRLPRLRIVFRSRRAERVMLTLLGAVALLNWIYLLRTN